jgi:tetratricopeptide (TPR) repeat protein
MVEDGHFWYDTERTNLIAATRQASSCGLDDIAWRLPTSLFSFFNRRSNWADCVTTHRIALDSSRRAGHRQGEGWVLNNLGVALGRKGVPEGIGYLEQALAIRREIGDRTGEAQAAHNLADACHFVQGPQAALEYMLRSLEVQREVGHSSLEAATLNNLGEVYSELGRLDEAVDCYQQARNIYTRINVAHVEGHTLQNLGRVYLELNRPNDALDCLRQALDVLRSTGDQLTEALTLKILGQAQHSVGQIWQARESWTSALTVFEGLEETAQVAEIRSALASLAAQPDMPRLGA